MSLFDIIPSIIGTLTGSGQASQGRNLVNQGQGDLNSALSNANNTWQQALGLVQQRQAQGAYDASAAMKAAGDQAAHALTLNDQNTAGQLATLGYKRGDSPFQQSAAQNSQNTNLALQQRLLDLQNQYQQKQTGDMSWANNYGGQYNNLLNGIGNQNIQRGTYLQQQADQGLGGIIGSLAAPGMFDFLKPSGGGGTSITPYQPGVNQPVNTSGGNIGGTFGFLQGGSGSGQYPWWARTNQAF